MRNIRHFSMSLVFGLLSLVHGQRFCEAGELLYSRLTDDYWQIWRQKEGEEAVQLTFSPYDKRYPSMTGRGELIYHTHNDRCYRMKGGKEEELLKELWPVRDLVPSPEGNLFVFSRFRTD
ncbi:hypothetical protein HYU13_05745, partial [Candidatus Woesearchaeota archaeon]|nr:hypothetical protein [Candidatus Woesearchaeota archaeon]